MRSNQTLRLAGVLAISLGLPASALAGGDAAAGKALAASCQACHVGDTGDIPHLSGQRPTYVAKQLKAFKAGDRKNPIMNAITGVLDDAAIDNLAAFWSSQPAATDATVPPEAAAIKKSKMTFPKEFPRGFTLYAQVNHEDKSSVSQQWVNAVGLQAVKAGKPMPDGSVIVVANYAAKVGADKKPVVGKDGAWELDKVQGYEGMEARAGWGKDIPELIRNVNWNYAIFSADKAPRAEVNQAICLTCHIPAAKTSFVFSLPKIQAKLGVK